MSDPLEPELTKGDLRVLRSLPPWEPWDEQPRPLSIWRIGEHLAQLDLLDLERTLNGLLDLGYAYSNGSPVQRRRLWIRSRRGDEAVGAQEEREP